MSAIKIVIIIILLIIWLACIIGAVYGALKIAEGDFYTEYVKKLERMEKRLKGVKK